MAKIIRTVTTEDNKIESVDDIFIFSTKNYIGIWNKDIQKYNILKKEISSYLYSDSVFNMDDKASTLNEFFEQVFAITKEELEEVYNFSTKVKIAIEEM